MRFYEVLLEDYKTSEKKYIDHGANINDVKTILNQFRKIQPRISDINLKNIDWWAKNRTFEQLKDYINNFEGIPTKSQIGKNTGRSHTIVENDQWLIVIPLDKDASCFHGKTTDWCTTKPFQSYFEQYFYDNQILLIYCVKKNNGSKWAIAAHKDNLSSSEYFDVNDKPLKKDEFENQTKLNVDEILSIAFGKDVHTEVMTSRLKYIEAISRIKELLREAEQTHNQNPEIEKLLWYTKNKVLLHTYMSLVGPADFNKNLEIFAINIIGATAITYIKNPSERIQLMSAKKDGLITLEYLLSLFGEDNISDAVKLEAVKEAPNIIGKLKNQSEELKRAAIETGYVNIGLINSPISEELKLLSVKKRPSSIRYIENPSEEMQILAVTGNGIILYDIFNNVSNIIPSKKVLLASVSNENADSAIEAMISNGVEITDEIITTALTHGEDIKHIIGIASINDIELSIPAQIAAVSNNPHAIYSLYILYKGKVNEAVQIVAARESGAGFIGETYRYIVTTRTLIDVSPHAVEEAFKTTTRLTGKMMKNMDSIRRHYGDEFKAFPTMQSFKNAINSLEKEEINSEIIDVIGISSGYSDLYTQVIDYAEKVARDTNNTMLQNLINEYKENNDLDNLSFEPEEKQ